jgi:hypothetical protein
MADDLDHAMTRLEELQLHYGRSFIKVMRERGGRVEKEGLARLDALPRRTGTPEYEDYVRRQMADYPQLHAERRVSRFELPSTAGTLLRLHGLIEDAHDTARWPGPRPLFGTVHSGRVNAMAVAIDSPAYFLVLIESGVFGFANLFAKAISRAFPLDADADGRLVHSADSSRAVARIMAPGTEGEELRGRFFDLVTAYAVHGDPHHAAAYFNEPEREVLHAGLLDGMELFVVAHERGHAFLEHFDRAVTRPLAHEGEGGAEYLPSWQQEFEADGFGLTIAAGTLARFGFDAPFAFAACCSFLAGVEILLRAVDVLNTGTTNSVAHETPTHPSPGMRAEMLRTYVMSTIGIEPQDGYFAICKTLLNVIEAYWQAVAPSLEALHHAGVRPVPLTLS